jgi:hypothetical protein
MKYYFAVFLSLCTANQKVSASMFAFGNMATPDSDTAKRAYFRLLAVARQREKK